MLEFVKTKTIFNIVKRGLCQGCGICAGACPKKAIVIIKSNGIYKPYVDKKKCATCRVCTTICPGNGIDLPGEARKLFTSSSLKQDYYIGHYERIYTGFSNNREIRYHSASGGLVTQFLIYLLDAKLIDGVVISKFDTNSPLEPVTFLAKTREEIISGKSSLYCPVSFDNVIQLINRETGRYIVVGLPCHIQALRKYSEINKPFSNKIFGYFTLYCSGSKNFFSQDYIIWRYGKKRKKITRFVYRDDGCLGYLKIHYQDGEVIKIPYIEYYLSMRGFFTPTRCTLCMDHYGELGDVSFGDIHVGKYIQDTIGTSSVVVRNEKFLQLFENARDKGVIDLEISEAEILNQSQQYVKVHKKGSGLRTSFFIRQKLGLHNPEYNFTIRDAITFKNGIRYFAHVISRKIGRSSKLWFLIPTIDKIALKLKLGLRRNE